MKNLFSESPLKMKILHGLLIVFSIAAFVVWVMMATKINWNA